MIYSIKKFYMSKRVTNKYYNPYNEYDSRRANKTTEIKRIIIVNKTIGNKITQ